MNEVGVQCETPETGTHRTTIAVTVSGSGTQRTAPHKENSGAPGFTSRCTQAEPK